MMLPESLFFTLSFVGPSEVRRGVFAARAYILSINPLTPALNGSTVPTIDF